MFGKIAFLIAKVDVVLC